MITFTFGRVAKTFFARKKKVPFLKKRHPRHIPVIHAQPGLQVCSFRPGLLLDGKDGASIWQVLAKSLAKSK
jgi:hypothetical protein